MLLEIRITIITLCNLFSSILVVDSSNKCSKMFYNSLRCRYSLCNFNSNNSQIKANRIFNRLYSITNNRIKSLFKMPCKYRKEITLIRTMYPIKILYFRKVMNKLIKIIGLNLNILEQFQASYSTKIILIYNPIRPKNNNSHNRNSSSNNS